MSDCCKTRDIEKSYVQENGIIRNQHGYLIARLCDGVTIDNVNEIGIKIETKESDGA